jgi:FlaA1/EpsC-like NDP-sugar epimerase
VFTSYRFERVVRAAKRRWRAVEARYLADRRVRRALKVGLDFLCGVAAFVVGIVMTQGIAAFGLERLLIAAAGVGLWLVIAEAVGGSYRTIWRYTSLADAGSVAVSSMTVLIGLLFVRVTGVLRLPAATILLIALLMLFLSVSLRAVRRWQAMGRWGGARAVRAAARYRRARTVDLPRSLANRC